MEARLSYKYSLAFKQKVVSEIEAGKIRSVNEAQQIYDIRGHGTVQKWIRKLGKNELIGKVVRVEMKNEADKIKELKRKIKTLESALANERIKTIALESLMEVAEERYGIDFKKNSSAAESKEAEGE
jgi:transposase-like protein